PPPAPPAAGAKPVTTFEPKRKQVIDVVQPPRFERIEPRPVEAGDGGDPRGDRDGDPAGAGGGSGVAGSTGDPLPPDPPAPPTKPRIVPPSMLDASRISGDKRIVPDDVTKT